MSLTDGAKTRGAFLSVLLVGAALVAGLTAFQYTTFPDKVSGKFSVTTRVRAVQVVATREGNVGAVFVRNGQAVDSGALLVRLTTDADPEAVLMLENDLSNWTVGTLPDLTPRSGLGELASRYANLRSEQQRLRGLLGNVTRENRKLYQRDQVSRTLLEEEIASGEIALTAAKQRLLDRKKELDAARNHYLTTKQKEAYPPFLERKKAAKLAEGEVEGWRSKLARSREELNKLDRESIRRGSSGDRDATISAGDLSMALTDLREAVRAWHQRHEVYAPGSGTVSFPEGNSPTGMVAATDRPLLTLLPPELNAETGLVAYVTIDGAARATLRDGLPVRLKFRDFDFHEHGYVEGVIERIPPARDDQEQYTVTVDLPRGLRTSTDDEPLPFFDGMTGTAEVFTKEITFWEMVF